MTRSFGGRARQFQLVTRERPPRAPAATFPVGDCLTESFNQADSATIGPDLAWLSDGAETHSNKFVALSGSIPVTYTESFNKADSIVIGPDLQWQKASFASNGTDGGVIRSNAYAVVGNPNSDDFGQCHIYLSNAQHQFNAQGVITVEATVVAKSAQGVGSGQVDYTSFYLSLGSGPFSYGAVAALFTNNGGDAVTLLDMANSPVSTAVGVTVGDRLGLIVTPNSPGSNLATLEAQINGVTVLTQTDAQGWDFAPAGLDIEASTVSQVSFTAGAQDRLDDFLASGEYTAANEGTAWTVDDAPSDDVKVSATIPDFDDSGSGVKFYLYARVGGTTGPADDSENWYRARFQSQGGSSTIRVESWWWGTITDQLTVTPALGVDDEIAFTITGTTDDFRLLCEVNGATVLDWGAADLTGWNGVDPADFQTEDGFGPFTGRRAGLGVAWSGSQDANALDNFQMCVA